MILKLFFCYRFSIFKYTIIKKHFQSNYTHFFFKFKYIKTQTDKPLFKVIKSIPVK